MVSASNRLNVLSSLENTLELWGTFKRRSALEMVGELRVGLALGDDGKYGEESRC